MNKNFGRRQEKGRYSSQKGKAKKFDAFSKKKKKYICRTKSTPMVLKGYVKKMKQSSTIYNYYIVDDNLKFM